jgi:hypothetical protein
MLKHIFFLSFLLGACAKPHYLEEQNSISQNSTGDCPYYFSSEDLCLRTRWDVIPSEGAFAIMTLTFFAKDTPSISIQPKNNPEVVLWMPSMGHGSSPVTITSQEMGIFRASDIYFIMPGPWEIRYQLRDESNHVADESIQNITI